MAYFITIIHGHPSVNFKSLIVAATLAGLLAGWVSTAWATVYDDATNDLFTIGAQEFDITSVAVTNDLENVSFTINLLGNPRATNWGAYAIAIATGSGGATNGNGSGAAILLTRGINFWLTSLGWGNLQVYQYSNAMWGKIKGGTFTNGTHSVTLAVPWHALGLTNGQAFQFDAYTFTGTGGAMDDLANPLPAIKWWSAGYTNNLAETYTLSGGSNKLPPSSMIPHLGFSAGGGAHNKFFRSQQPATSLTVHLVADSTVAIWSSNNYPKTGWGQVLGNFFNPASVTVDDAAVSGASAKSFYHRFWSAETNKIKPGDFVFIQFGINDGNTNAAFYSAPETTFKRCLTDYVNDTLALGAHPVLVTPQRGLGRGRARSWGAYPQAIRELAATLGVPLIDLDAASGAWISSVGASYAASFCYLNLPAGVYSNYPAGNTDGTHLQAMGAIEMAKLVVQGVQNLAADTNVAKLIPSLKPLYQASFSPGGSAGLVTLGECFPAGIAITAQAIPFSGHAFTEWSGDLTSTNAVATFIMGSTPMKITAHFNSP